MRSEESSKLVTPLGLVATVAVLALVGVGVLAGILIGKSGSSSPIARTVPGTSHVASEGTSHSTTTIVVQQARPAPSTPVTVPASAPSHVTATGTWPAATSAWTVVLVSSGAVAEAETVRARAGAAGLGEAGILLSTQHSSLRPGYWVAFTGVLSHDDAVARAQQARADGFADAYVRYVSAG